MRASKTSARGTSGASYVTAILEELGWGVAPNPLEHDLGTDLWVSPRDERGFDLGLMLGAQVKNGPSYFRTPGRHNDDDGWWLVEDSDHLNYWLGHAIPHVVMLRDPATRVVFWGHVRPESVVWTGVGGKVFVAKARVLDGDALPELVSIASDMRGAPVWNGSAWAGAPDLSPSDQLRFAMLAPRLVAPHPNKGAPSIEAHEGIALLASGRFGELGPRFGLDDAPRSGWRWDFYRAILAFAETQALAELITCREAATEPAEAAAATAALAAGFIETGDVDQALVVLDETIGADKCEPIDHAWLLVHRARALSLVGRKEDARDDALRALPALPTGDVTAGAIAGAGAAVVFQSVEMFKGDIAGTIAATDNEAAWWLAQAVSWGLSTAMTETFNRWIDNPNRVTLTNDPSQNRLRGVALVAGFGALQAQWAHATTVLAQTAFMSGALESGDQAAYLRMLCRAGSHEAVQGVVQRLLLDGSADAVTAVASEVDLDSATRTDVRATLELLVRGADVVSPADADRFISWALRPATDRQTWADRTTPGFLIEMKLAELVAALLPAASESTTQAVRAHLTTLPPQTDQAVAREWARVIDVLPREQWTTEDVELLVARADDQGPFTDAVTRAAFVAHDATRAAVLEQLERGDLHAMQHVGYLYDIPASSIPPLIDVLAVAVRERQRQIATMVAMGRVLDPERILTLLNVLHPDQANWDPIVELLESPLSLGSDTVSVLQALRVKADDIPEVTKRLLASAIERAASRGPSGRVPNDADHRAFAHATLGVFFPDEHQLRVDEVGRDWRSRQALVRGIGTRRDPADFVALALSACDPDPRVRATAAAALTDWAMKAVHEQALPTLVSVLDQDSGVHSARAAAAELGDPLPTTLRALARQLASHASAAARNAAQRALGADEPEIPATS